MSVRNWWLASLALVGMSAHAQSTPYGGTAVAMPGRIEAEKYDLGGEGTAYHDNDPVNTGGQFRTDGVDLVGCSDTGGGQALSDVRTGEWLKYTVTSAATADYALNLRVASAVTGARFHLEVDGINATGTVTVPNTGSTSTWQTVTKDFTVLRAGTHVLKLVAESNAFSVNWLELTSARAAYAPGIRSIPGQIEAEHYDQGSNSSGFYDTTAGNQGGALRADDVDIRSCPESASAAYCVIANASGEWLDYSVTVAQAGFYSYSLRTSGASVINSRLSVDGVAVNSSQIVTSTGSDSTFATTTVGKVYLPAGDHVLRLNILSAGSGNQQVDWIKFTGPQTAYNGSVAAIPGKVELENYDVGGEGVTFHDTDSVNNGGTYRTDGVDLMACTDSGCGSNRWVYNLMAGEWLEYTIDIAYPTIYAVSLRGTPQSSGPGPAYGSVTVSIDSGGYPFNCDFPAAGSTPVVTQCGTQSLTAGKHLVRVSAGSSSPTNIDYVAITPTSSVVTGCGTCNNLPGKIEAENYDNGGQGVGYSDSDNFDTLGSNFRSTGGYIDGVDIASSTDSPASGTVVGRFDDLEWMNYTVNAVQAGPFDLRLRVASITGATLQLYVDGNVVSGNVGIPNTGSNSSWQTVTIANVPMSAGSHLVMVRNYGGHLYLNWLQFDLTAVNDAAPVVSLTAPTNGSTYSPSSITLSATAADTDGTISKVEFYNGTTLLGTATTPPYSYTWTGAAVGTATITARAYDNFGISTTSSAATITINTPPTVTLVSPSASPPVLDAPATVNLQATASDSDGSVTKVEYYNGSTLIAAVNAPSTTWSATWTNVSYGSYIIRAKAYDNLGASTYSTSTVQVVNARPTASITAPANNASYAPGSNITLTATAADADGTISKVEFYNGATLLGTVSASPYTYTWTNVPANASAYSITAKAYDNRNATSTSTAISVIVNALPTVSIATPAANAVVSAPGSFTLTANAADSDGSIAKVEYYAGATLIGTVNAPSSNSWSLPWSSVAAGSYSLTAKAYDNRNAVTTSAAVAVTVNALPTVTIALSPTMANNTYGAPATVTVNATASDSDGTISKVEFYNGSTLVSTVTAAPYSTTLSNLAVGTYTVTAKSYDNRNVASLNAVTTITVINNQAPVVWLNSPSAPDTTFAAPASIALSASAGDGDGSISKVEFYSNGVLILGATVPSGTGGVFAYSWSGVAAGSYTITAKAYDNLGAVATSSPSTVSVINGQKPTVSITSPTANSGFAVDDAITITANASDGDGTISRVEFYSGVALIGSVAGGTSPYTFVWSNKAASSTALTAKAYDNSGLSAVSAPVAVDVWTAKRAMIASGASFSVVMDEPWHDMTIPAHGAAIFSARGALYSNNSHPKAVEFRVDGAQEWDGEFVSAGIVHVNAFGIPTGVHTLDVKVIDTVTSQFAVAPQIRLTVVDDQEPAVTLTQPTVTSYASSPTIHLAANATDTDGTVKSVDFYRDGYFIGTSTSAPFQYDYENAPSGHYRLSAIAYDNVGAMAYSSNSIDVTVAAGSHAPPTITWVLPENISSSASPYLHWLVKANAATSNGHVDHVDFYDGKTLLGAATAAPFEIVRTKPTNYTALYARVFDDAGAFSETPIRWFNTTLEESALSVDSIVDSAVLSVPGDIQIAGHLNGDWSYEDYLSHRPDYVLVVEGENELIRCPIQWGRTDPAPFPHSVPYQCVLPATSGEHTYHFVVGVGRPEVAVSEVVRKVSVSVAPTVAIVSPKNGSTVHTGMPTVLVANAYISASAGFISKVEFFDFTTALPNCTLTASPFTCTTPALSAGPHEFTAKATLSSTQASATSATVAVTAVANRPPTVVLTAPNDRQTVILPATIRLAASATDSDGNNTVMKVRYYDNGTQIAEVAPPFLYSWTTATPGTHVITAKAIDDLDLSSTMSAASTITVAGSGPGVTLSIAPNSATVSAATVVTMTAAATPGNATINKVEFLVDDVVQNPTGPLSYSYPWTASSLGAHTLAVRVTDNATPPRSALSNPITLTVIDDAPRATIIAPAGNITVAADPSNKATVNFQALATVGSGTIHHVDYYDNGNLLVGTPSSPSTPPYTFTAVLSGIGAHPITAKAVDNAGRTSVPSTPVIVSVSNGNAGPDVRLVSPVAGSRIVVPQDRPLALAIDIDSTDADGSIASIFASISSSLGGGSTTTTSSQSRFTWNITIPPIASGGADVVYSLYIRATDNVGKQTVISPSFTVGRNQLPTSVFIDPEQSPSVMAGNDFNLSLRNTAVDVDGRISKVEFYRCDEPTSESGQTGCTGSITDGSGNLKPGYVLVATANSAPFSTTVHTSTSDQFTTKFRLRAYDDVGDSVDSLNSSMFYVGRNSAPYRTSIVFPLNGDFSGQSSLREPPTFQVGQQVTFGLARGSSADGLDPDGNASKIEIRSLTYDFPLGTQAKPFPISNTPYQEARVTVPLALAHSRMQQVVARVYDDFGAWTDHANSSIAADNGAAFSEPLIVAIPNTGAVPRACRETGDPSYTCTQNAQSTPWTFPATDNDAIRIEAERYDSGGAGVGYFMSRIDNAVTMPRLDDVEIYSSEDINGNVTKGCSAAGPGCVVGRQRNGDYLRYSINVPVSGLYRVEFLGPTWFTSRVPECFFNPGAGRGVAAQTDGLQTDVIPSDDSPYSVSFNDELTSQATSNPEYVADPADGPMMWQETTPYLPAGDYIMRVKATRNSRCPLDRLRVVRVGATAAQTVLTLNSPADGSAFTVGRSIEVDADLTSSLAYATSNVLFLVGPRNDQTCDFSASSVQNTTYPAVGPGYRASISGLAAGTYCVEAVAGAVNATSNVAKITVANTASPTAPVVAITSPGNGANTSPGGTFTVTVTASTTDASRTISSVQITDNGAPLTIGLPAPATSPASGTYNKTVTWTNVPSGTHVLQFSATDNSGQTGQSATVTVSATTGGGGATTTDSEAPATPVIPPIDNESDRVGAIPGKFRVSESGAATYSIPIALQPGMAGMAPQIALQYSSDAGDGIAGMGWSLSGTGAVSRCRQSRESGDINNVVNPYSPSSLQFPDANGNERDPYCMNGQRLIQVAGGAHGSTGAEYRSEIDGMSRIRIATEIVDPLPVVGAPEFVVDGKDGSRLTFGGLYGRKATAGGDQATNARIYVTRPDGNGGFVPYEPTVNHRAVLTWSLSRTEDTLGNFVDYYYTDSSANGEQLLDEIHYTGHKGGNAPFAWVKFNYKSRAASATTSYVSGMRMQHTKLLDRIDVYEGSSTLVRSYRLTYEAESDTAHPRLIAVLLCSAATGGVCYPPTTFDYNNRALGVSTAPGDVISNPGSTSDFANTLYDVDAAKYGDINGDGRTDIVFMRNSMVCWSIARKQGFGFDTTCPMSVDFPGGVPLIRPVLQDQCQPGSDKCVRNPQMAFQLYDFNGDGRDDLLIGLDWRVIGLDSNGKQTTEWFVLPSYGDPTAEHPYTFNLDNRIDMKVPTAGRGEGMLADMDGDGIPDLIASQRSGGGGDDGRFPIDDLPPCCLLQRGGTEVVTTPVETPSDVIPNPTEDAQIIYRLVRDHSPLGAANQFVECPGGLKYCFQASASGPAAFGNIVAFDGFDNKNVFPQDWQCLRYAEPLGSLIFPTIASTYMSFTLDGSGDIFDVNGDGMGDLRIRIKGMIWDGTNCVQREDSFTHERVVSHYVALKNMGVDPTTGHWVFRPVVAARIGDQAGEIKAVKTERDYRWQMVDLNGDGLADELYERTTTANVRHWFYRLNLGGNNGTAGTIAVDNYQHWYAGDQFGPEIALTDLDAVVTGDSERSVQVTDYDGDGLVDIVYGVDGATERSFKMLRGTGSGFSAPTLLSGVTSEKNQNSQHSSFIDLDGDGHPEQLSIDYDSKDHNSVVVRRSAVAGRFVPGDTLAKITNGLGMVTLLDYAPLTNAAVYRPGSGTVDASWTMGHGSPVFDLRSPMYVVRRARSSAPLEGNPDALSAVLYRYRGMRMQSGGRGSLGFEEVQSLDVQSAPDTGTETSTRYDQSYPFVGSPIRTRVQMLSGAEANAGGWTASPSSSTPACLGADVDLASSGSCFSYFPPSQREWPLPNNSTNDMARAVHYATDVYAAVLRGAGGYPATMTAGAFDLTRVVTPTPMFVFKSVSESIEREMNTLQPTSSEKTFTNSFDSYGNLLATTSDRYDGGGNKVRTTTSTNSYINVIDDSRWFLGRLTDTTVTTSVTDTTIPLADRSVTRNSHFEYRLGGATGTANDGLLTAEIVQAGDSRPGFSLITAYDYDAVGNKVKIVSCDGLTSTWQSCLATTENALSFAPRDAMTVRRLKTVSYGTSPSDPTPRYPVDPREVFDNGTGASSALTTLATTTRDAYGNPIKVVGINNSEGNVVYGPLFRKQFEWTNSGTATTTILRYCSSAALPSVRLIGTNVDPAGEVVPGAREVCPSNINATYLTRVTSKSGPPVVQYFDRLGREVSSWAGSLQKDFYSATRTFYDAEGRVVRKYQPCMIDNTQGGNSCSSAATSSVYDALGRVTQMVQPDGGVVDNKYETLKVTASLPINTDSYRQMKIDTTDALGRIVKVEENSDHLGQLDGNPKSVVCYRYRATGELLSVIKKAAANASTVDCSDPAVANGAVVTSMRYDTLGRKTHMDDPDKGSWDYVFNAAGETVQESSSRGCTLSYFDARGRQQAREDHVGSCSGSLEHRSVWEYDRAVLGTFAANVLGALSTEKVYLGTSNQPTQVKRVTYDNLARVSKTSTTLDGREYIEHVTYDKYSRARQSLMSSPEFPVETGIYTQYSDEIVGSGYNPGFAVRMRDAAGGSSGTVYSETTAVDGFGNVITANYDSNRVSVGRSYDSATGALRTETVASVVNGDGHALSYDWDRAGNLISRTSRGKVESYHYDGLNRLVGSSGLPASPTPPSPYTVGDQANAQNYSAFGNISSRAEGTTSYAYVYAQTSLSQCASVTGAISQPGPHAVTSMTSGGVTTTYCYDATGNQLAARSGNGDLRDISYSVAEQATEIRAISAGQGSTVRFAYGAGRERIRREDWATNFPSGSAQVTTHYAAGAEILLTTLPNNCVSTPYGDVTVRRYFGELIITQKATRSSCGGSAITSTRKDFKFNDNLGSTDVLIGENGKYSSATDGGPALPGSQQSYSAWGQRRDPNTWAITSVADLFGYDTSLTRKGFGGHEQLDRSGLVHMGGRIYDPKLGRFIQADPMVRDAYLPQTLNRYTYVRNNPLSYTDPTGYMDRSQREFAQFVGIAIATVATAIYFGPAAAGQLTGETVTAANYAAAAAYSAAGGFITGAAATGTIKGAVQGAFEGAANSLIGSAFMTMGPDGHLVTMEMTPVRLAEKSLAHAALGGVMESLRGGSFGHGFVTAGVTEALSPAINGIKNQGLQFVTTVVVGGTMSKLSGGKFVNGAATAAFSYAFNHCQHDGCDSSLEQGLYDWMPGYKGGTCLYNAYWGGTCDFWEGVDLATAFAPGAGRLLKGGGKFFSAMAPLVVRTATAAERLAEYGYNAQKVNHIFSRSEKLMEPLIKLFGNKMQAMLGLHDASQFLADAKVGYQTGQWVAVQVAEHWVYVKGRVMDGIFYVSTASMRPF